MNKFKKRLKQNVGRSDMDSEITDKTNKLDEKINASITETLYKMFESSNDKEDKIQIMDRMLSLNNLFNKGFDKEIKKLKELENIENEK